MTLKGDIECLISSVDSEKGILAPNLARILAMQARVLSALVKRILTVDARVLSALVKRYLTVEAVI